MGSVDPVWGQHSCWLVICWECKCFLGLGCRDQSGELPEYGCARKQVSLVRREAMAPLWHGSASGVFQPPPGMARSEGGLLKNHSEVMICKCIDLPQAPYNCMACRTPGGRSSGDLWPYCSGRHFYCFSCPKATSALWFLS